MNRFDRLLFVMLDVWLFSVAAAITLVIAFFAVILFIWSPIDRLIHPRSSSDGR